MTADNKLAGKGYILKPIAESALSYKNQFGPLRSLHLHVLRIQGGTSLALETRWIVSQTRS